MIRLRRATAHDALTLEQWDTEPDVIAATTDDDVVDRAFGGLDWREEILQSTDDSYYLLAELDGRPIGAMQIIDPHTESTHYWGDIEPNLRAVDIWIGAPDDRGKGYGAAVVQAALEHAARNGCTSASLRSGPKSVPLYERLGFQYVCQHRTYAFPGAPA